MSEDKKPLYTLTIEEFITLTKKLIAEVINGSKEEKGICQENTKSGEEVFDILELATSLRCSKVSIHNYKKMGMPYTNHNRNL